MKETKFNETEVGMIPSDKEEQKTANQSGIVMIRGKVENAETGFVNEIKQLIFAAQKSAYSSIASIMLQTYWSIGKRIIEQEQKGKKRADYGTKLLKLLSFELTKEFGTGYSERNLRNFRKFYLFFPEQEIWNACVPNLNWTHFRSLLRVADENARLWYLQEAASQNWNTRTLDRNIGTQYYYRLLQSPKKEAVIKEMQQDTKCLQTNKFELLKNPIVAEFLGFKAKDSFAESDLESAILDHLRDFILEMGKGFAFVSRQQHIVTDTRDYFIDLVFYNIELKCYVLIDLKIGTVTHQDVGQMDMYIRMYDELKCKDGDNPTIGILLCSETSEDIARFSILHDSNNLFMAKYLTFLPTREQLRNEIEQQKEIFYMQHPELNEKER